MDIKSKKADIHFRVSIGEKEMIEGAARENGKSLSDYARDILLAASAYKTTNNITGEQTEELQILDSRREKDIHVRVSNEELIYCNNQAKEAGLSLSEYVRRSAYGNEIYVVPGMKELAKQLAKLGVNVNQLTVLAHQGKIKEVDLFSTNDTLKQILKELIKLNKKKG